MADVLSKEQRHYCMSRIRDKNTKPEIIVRQIVWSLGFRYRLHVKDLPGKPDLVFKKNKKIILVHGCFWHMHSCKYGRVVPKTNADFWQTKRLSNKSRDVKTKAALKNLGWRVLVVWECQTKNIPLLLSLLANFLGPISAPPSILSAPRGNG